MVRLLHTADLHLDGAFAFLGADGGRTHRRQLLATFDRIIEEASQGGYDLLIIAGDLFDSSTPSQTTVEHVKRRLEGLAIPVCLLPGNHDPDRPGSLYRREQFAANVHVLRDVPTMLEFPHLGLTIAGSPCSETTNRPALAGVTRPVEARYFVAVAHGNLQISGYVESENRPLHPAEIAATHADYVALGDWHGWRDCSVDGVSAYYSGAPEPTTRTQRDTGFVASVTLDERGVVVTRRPIGRVRNRNESLDLTQMDYSGLVTQLLRWADPHTILSVQLTGLKAVDAYLDLDALYAAVAEHYYGLHLFDDATTQVNDAMLAQFPEMQVIGQYVRLLQAEIAGATDPVQRQIAEEALQIGVALLQGKEVLR